MCHVLAKKEVLKVDSTGQQTDKVNFRKLLITRCQKEFERDYLEDVDQEKYHKMIEEAETEEKKKEAKALLEEEERIARR